MGCSGSKIDVYVLEPVLKDWKCEFDTLGFTDLDIAILYKVLAGNSDEKLSKLEITKIMGRLGTKSKLLHRSFEQLDSTGSGHVSFRDAILTLWYFCTLGDEVMREYVFDLYDEDGNQKLDHKEYEGMLKGILGTQSVSGDFKE